MNKQSGIAMVMMLFISAILALLTINFIHQSNHQIKIAQRLKNKTQAFTNVQNAKAQILFNLLSKPTIELEQQGWNFYSKPFEIENTMIQIQDLRGVFGLYGFISQVKFVKLLEQCRVNDKKLSNIANLVLSKHFDQELPVDKLQRLEHLLGEQSDKTHSCLQRNITRHGVGSFNPSVAPIETLIARMGEDDAQKFILARSQGRESINQLFSEIISDDIEVNSYSTLAGPYFRVIFSSRVADSYWVENIEFKVKLSTPYDPIIFLSYQSGFNE